MCVGHLLVWVLLTEHLLNRQRSGSFWAIGQPLAEAAYQAPPPCTPLIPVCDLCVVWADRLRTPEMLSPMCVSQCSQALWHRNALWINVSVIILAEAQGKARKQRKLENSCEMNFVYRFLRNSIYLGRIRNNQAAFLDLPSFWYPRTWAQCTARLLSLSSKTRKTSRASGKLSAVSHHSSWNKWSLRKWHAQNGHMHCDIFTRGIVLSLMRLNAMLSLQRKAGNSGRKWCDQGLL